MTPAITIEHPMIVPGERKLNLALAAIRALRSAAKTPITVLAQVHLPEHRFHIFCLSIISSGITRAIKPPPRSLYDKR
jgi:hypothetical protein